MENHRPRSSGTTAGTVSRFFDEFDLAFRAFDGAVIAERYAEPYVACRADGSSANFGTRDDTARYFQDVIDNYFSMGVRSCTHRDVEAVGLGAQHWIASVTWDLLDESSEVVTSWRESYVLVDDAGRLLVRTSIDH